MAISFSERSRRDYKNAIKSEADAAAFIDGVLAAMDDATNMDC